VVCTPHLGASTDEAQERVAVEVAEQVVAFLLHGTITNAVNVPSVSREAAAKLAPYLELARKLGAFLAQVGGVPPRSIEVECAGEPAELGASAVTSAAVAGVLARFLDAPVNQVSAPHLAADRGITVRELRTQSAGRFAHLIDVRVRGGSGERLTAEGTLGADRSAHLVRWGDYELSAELSGHAVVLFNADKPGVIGAIGTILGGRQINVSQVQLGRSAKTKEALSVWNVDSAIGTDVLDEVRKASFVQSAIAIRLD